MTDVVSLLRTIALDPAALAAREELQRVGTAWIDRRRRRTEVVVTAGS